MLDPIYLEATVIEDTEPCNLPSGWANTTLGEVFKWGSGGTPRRNVSHYYSGPIPWAIIGDLNDGLVNKTANSITILGLEASNARIVPVGSVLLAMYGSIGKLGIVGTELATNQAIAFTHTGVISNKYLFWYLRASRSALIAQGKGDTQSNISQMVIKGFPFLVAPLAEQRRIVAEIEKHFTRLDASIAALKRVQANLKRYRASVLKAACGGKLVPTEAELAQTEGRDYEPADQLLMRILTERRTRWESHEKRGRRYKEPVAPSTTGLPDLPEGWSYVLIQQIFSLTRSGLKTGPFGSLLKKHEHKKTGVPVLGIENIQRMNFVPGNKIFVTSHKAQELSSYDVHEGDILISRSGTVGEACVVPSGLGDARLSTNLMRITLAKEYVSPQYFCLLFDGSPTVLDQVSALCGGSTRDFLNGKILQSIVFPLPPLAEQRRIVAEVERHLSVIQQTEAAVEANLVRADRLRQSILKQAFSRPSRPPEPQRRTGIGAAGANSSRAGNSPVCRQAKT